MFQLTNGGSVRDNNIMYFLPAMHHYGHNDAQTWTVEQTRGSHKDVQCNNKHFQFVMKNIWPVGCILSPQADHARDSDLITLIFTTGGASTPPHNLQY
jgi:hypothetical protein